ncbi:hypothetical protein IFM89_012110 [Coptis chinensis]|uniref:Uncharacterized protein n=1 Tax=Coptis chinensis TaxID=261450 RepID=A0A835I2K6_9MAGN|nr:hypothetical protein IFM89_012110 [Coptis chinensis]
MENNQSPQQPKSTKAKGNYVVWTIEMDRVLIETFLDQVQKETNLNKVGSFVVLDESVDAIKEKCGKAKDSNDNCKMIVVRDDVWENYVKSHPNAKGFRRGELDKAREEVENNGSNENDGHEDINGENEGSDKQLKRGSDEKQSANKSYPRRCHCQQMCDFHDRYIEVYGDKTKEHVFYGLPG